MTKVKAFGIGAPWIDLHLAIAFMFKGASLSSYPETETEYYAGIPFGKVRRWRVTVNGTPVRGPYTNDRCTATTVVPCYGARFTAHQAALLAAGIRSGRVEVIGVPDPKNVRVERYT